MNANEVMAKRSLLALIADEKNSVPGLLLAGVGQIPDEPGKETYLLTEEAEEAFDRFTSGRDDIALLLINQHIASRRDIELFNGHQEPRLKDHNQVFFSSTTQGTICSVFRIMAIWRFGLFSLQFCPLLDLRYTPIQYQ
ncbi:hypothetical protein HF325_002187 [Metschnikowia pulcherrima]|uniref:Uncharacterized protein n=1 Tax=Metschnikowia pulcherrima TaxID=27326 RepID=A0A8H7GTY3_9ASCO|nr:hypothetical protein HF325_002187 [Metschnikowia pulcherrima]